MCHKSGTTGSRSVPHFGRYTSKPHKAAIRMVGYALTLIDLPSMWELAAGLYARLTGREHAFLAIAVLWSLTDDDYKAVLEYMAGEP